MTGTSARWAQYLDDLARMLDGLPPAERAEVLGSVREHIDDALAELGDTPTPSDVEAVLQRIGRPSEVAKEAFESHEAAAGHPTEVRLRWPHLDLGRRWVAPTAPALLLMGGAMIGLEPRILLVWPLYLAGLVLVWKSPLWSTPERVVGSIAPIAGGVLATLMWNRLAHEASWFSWLGSGVAAVTVVLMVVLAIRGAQRSAGAAVGT